MMKPPQNLIFDADDTLWENNIYYEKVREQFLLLTDKLGVDRATVGTQIDMKEQNNIKLHGYGSENFIRSLKETYRHFAGDRNHDQDILSRIDALGSNLYDFHIDLLPNVATTLGALTRRHRCFMLTKGDSREQLGKVKKSQLGHHFKSVEVVPEKTPDTYETMARKFGFDKTVTWMIGNSPRSDINPSLAAGLGAVYIPHAVTWHFEKVPLIESHPRLIVLKSFGELLKIF